MIFLWFPWSGRNPVLIFKVAFQLLWKISKANTERYREKNCFGSLNHLLFFPCRLLQYLIYSSKTSPQSSHSKQYLREYYLLICKDCLLTRCTVTGRFNYVLAMINFLFLSIKYFYIFFLLHSIWMTRKKIRLFAYFVLSLTYCFSSQ